MTVEYSAPLSAELRDLLDSVPEAGPVETGETRYRSNDVELGAFVARPAGEHPLLPGVLVMSDWSGLGDHARVRAQMLARLGYIAVAGDVYGEGKLVSNEEAPGEAGRYYSDPELFRSRMTANLEHLRAEPGVDPDRIAVMGYCFGGSAALELARSGAEVAGVVAFHGGLQTGAPAAEGAVKAPLLVLTGSSDPVVPDEAVVAFENELRDAGAPDWQIVTYSGAMHAFTMPGVNAPEHGAAYNESANRRSWVAMKAFFDEIFAGASVGAGASVAGDGDSDGDGAAAGAGEASGTAAGQATGVSDAQAGPAGGGTANVDSSGSGSPQPDSSELADALESIRAIGEDR